MSAGTSALETAGRLRKITRRWQERAQNASVLTQRFEAGAEGEAFLAECLEPLAAHGWRLMHDRRLAGGGNLDSLAVGPSGIAVVDSKNWTGEVSFAGAELRQNGHLRPRVLEGLDRQVEAVEAALEEAGLAAPVRGFVAFTSPQHRDLPLAELGAHRLGGAYTVASFLGAHSSGPLTGQRLGVVQRYLDERFPEASGLAPSPVARSLASLEQERSFFGIGESAFLRLWYIRAWRNHGHHRLYLKMANGEDLGWKDVRTGAVHLTCEGGDERLVEAVLKSATPFGVKLPTDEMPRVPAELLGSRLVGRISRVYVSLLLGQEWRKGATKRLYGRLIDRAEGHFDLGYVDLSSGELRPSIDGKLNGRLRSAADYLQALAEGCPARGSAEL